MKEIEVIKHTKLSGNGVTFKAKFKENSGLAGGNGVSAEFCCNFAPKTIQNAVKMKSVKLYTLLALLLTAGGVTMQAQNESYFTYEDPNVRFSEGGPCLEVGSDESENHFFLASAFDFSYDWFAYE